MNTGSVGLERRAGQRFEFHLPISIEFGGRTVPAFSQNLSARGVFLYSEENFPEGATVQLIFTMPSEVTLAENMRVRCRGRVLRSSASGCGNGIAVQFDSYQYLPSTETNVELTRISSSDTGSEPSRVGAR